MFNSKAPVPGELPSSRQLLRSTLIAAAVAVGLLTFVVLPAEYGIDPTGLGRALGLAQMGEIKSQLAKEAAADVTADPAETAPVVQAAEEATRVAQWRDEMRVPLEPGAGAEVKLTMKQGEQAEFQWQVEGGAVNFDLHGDGGKGEVSYQKGRNVPGGEGRLEAAFDGNHGWFWRNRGEAAVTVIIRARGQYGEMKRML